MPGLLQGLELGKRALLTHQVYLQTIGHNIANVNTPGFRRQRVHITTTYPEELRAGTVGTGVTVTDIRHVRDTLLAQQYRRESKSLGQWSYREKIMPQIELVFNEPNGNTLSEMLNKFWDAWSDLSIDPTSAAYRTALVDTTNLLTQRFHDMAAQLDRLREGVNRDLVSAVDEINSYTTQIAQLNGKIRILEVGGTPANDLRDTRDRLIDELTELVDVNTVEQRNGDVIVFIGAMAVVDGDQSIPVTTESYGDGNAVLHRLTLGGSDLPLTSINGQIKALLDTRDQVIPVYREELNVLAAQLVQQVNTLHVTGFGLDGSTGRDFFDAATLDAANVRLNPGLAQAPQRIAASASGEVGDNSVALAIQDLRNRRIMYDNTSTLSDYYGTIVGQLGMQTLEAQTQSENYSLLVHQISSAREAVQGVSLDEEMANMVKFQHAYDAAARIITAMDEALDTVILRMGIVGR